MTDHHAATERTVRVTPPAQLRAELEARASARPRARRPRRLPRGRLGFLLASLTTGLLVAGVFADSGSLNVEVANKTQYKADSTTDGAIVEYIGDSNVSFGAAGTGLFDSFLRVQADGTEAGYNTNGTLQFDSKPGTWTHAIKVSSIPVVPCRSLDTSITTSGFCWELFADINETNSTPKIALTDLEIYFTTNQNITNYPFTGAPNLATKVYDFSGEIKINDVNQGSGRGDLRYLVPLTGITIPSNCSYGNAACGTYFVLYTKWGASGGSYTSDGGFEEWKVKQYPFLQVTKTAATTFTRTFNWEIAKSVSPATWNLFTGDSGTSDYTVSVTKTGSTDSNWAVSGTITITNPSGQDAVIASVTDEISGVGSASVSCPVSFPFTLSKGGTLTCTYSRSLPDGTNRTNTATATLDSGLAFTGTAAVTFGSPTTVVNGTVHVSDTNGGSWTFSDTGSQTYSRTFSCDADKGTHDNTATITETGQTASASVTVNCYGLEVSKTAETSFTRTFNWKIAKSVSPDTWNLFTGDSGTSDYTVSVTKTGFTDSDWAVHGTISVHNPAPVAATLTDVADAVDGVGAKVDCGGVTFPYSLGAGATLQCTYSADLPNADDRTNTATATLQNFSYASDGTPTKSGTTDFTGSASVTFGDPTKVVNDTVHVNDTNGGSWTFSDTGSATYSQTFKCDADKGTHDNTATITETGQTASASVTVNCYGLEVSKTAETSFARTYHWTIKKSSNDPNGQLLTLNPGEVYANYPYQVTVDATFTDGDWAVHGTISVHNPAPVAATLTGVADAVSGVGAASVDCGVTFPYSLAANATLTCMYSLSLPNADDRTNTATATLQNHSYASDGTPTESGTTLWTGSANVSFASAAMTEVDKSITVTDTVAGTLGTATYGVDTLPKTFTYTRTFGPFGTDACGEHDFPNTASFTTHDTQTTGESSWNVHVTVPCPTGCTLTQGYWKTHSVFGPAKPSDPIWDLLPGGLGANTPFFTSNQTWYQVFWTNPKGGNAYYILAHQYMAAKLNILAGAASTPEVDAAIAWAETFFGTHGPNDSLSKAVRQQAIAAAGVLGSYNEGLIGPGHCSEDSIARSTS